MDEDTDPLNFSLHTRGLLQQKPKTSDLAEIWGSAGIVCFAKGLRYSRSVLHAVESNSDIVEAGRLA
jgi:hypothetical protein